MEGRTGGTESVDCDSGWEFRNTRRVGTSHDTGQKTFQSSIGSGVDLFFRTGVSRSGVVTGPKLRTRDQSS